MAKAISSLITLKGEVNGLLFTNGDKQGPRVRKMPVVNPENNDPKFKEQSARAAVLNKLASQINKIIRTHYEGYKKASFYQQLISCFRRQPSDNRYLLLRQLVGMDLDRRYRLEERGSFTSEISQEVHRLTVVMKTARHPPNFKEKSTDYRYELLLLSWTAHGEKPVEQRRRTAWIPLKGDKPTFDFEFPLPEETTQWLLFVRQCLGANEKESPVKPAQAIHIYEAGSLLDSDRQLYNELFGTPITKKEDTIIEDDVPVVEARKG
jgi:hypothetical protein